MPDILRRMLKNPDLPANLRTPEGWPDAMRKEWGDDEGTTSAGHHRTALVAWMRRARAALDAFNPDFVLIWGDDQYENFREDIIPPYCINAYDQFSFKPPANNVWGETDKTYQLAGNREAAKMLATGLIEHGFDTAYSYKPLHHPLGHAFTNAIFYLDYDRKGFPYPIVPFAVNCYGRKVVSQRGGVPAFDVPVPAAELDPPAPAPWRLFDLGAETARIHSLSHLTGWRCWRRPAGRMLSLRPRTITSIPTRRRTGGCTTIFAPEITTRGGTIPDRRWRRAASRRSSIGCAWRVRLARSTASRSRPASSIPGSLTRPRPS
jgi:hypothetical protein